MTNRYQLEYKREEGDRGSDHDQLNSNIGQTPTKTHTSVSRLFYPYAFDFETEQLQRQLEVCMQVYKFLYIQGYEQLGLINYSVHICMIVKHSLSV